MSPTVTGIALPDADLKVSTVQNLRGALERAGRSQ